MSGDDVWIVNTAGHERVAVPRGFPADLSDKALETKAAELGEELRLAAKTGDNNHLVVCEAFHDAARSELQRRALRRSERLSRFALGISIFALLLSSALAVVSVVVAARDPTPDRVVEVRDAERAELGRPRASLAADARRERALLEAIERELERGRGGSQR